MRGPRSRPLKQPRGDRFTLGFRWRIKPGPHLVGDGFQLRVADVLAVDARHVVVRVTHNVIDGWLIFSFVRDGPKGVAKGVEPKPRPAVDVQGTQEFPHFLADWICRGVFGP